MPRAAALSLGVCLLYATASLSLSMLNKALLSRFVRARARPLAPPLQGLAAAARAPRARAPRVHLPSAPLCSYAFDGYFMLLAFQLGISYTICVISRDYFGNPLDVPKFSMALIAECVCARARRRWPRAAGHAPTAAALPSRVLAGPGPWA